MLSLREVCYYLMRDTRLVSNTLTSRVSGYMSGVRFIWHWPWHLNDNNKLRITLTSREQRWMQVLSDHIYVTVRRN